MEVFIELINNATLLISLAMLHSLLLASTALSSPRRDLYSGFLFGIAGVIGMSLAIEPVPGVVFDARSTVLSMAGLFGGPLVAGIAASMLSLYRSYLGGVGMPVGLVIIFATSAIGVGGFYLRRAGTLRFGWKSLFLFGVLIHLVVLISLFGLPSEVRSSVLNAFAVPRLIIYPVATLAFGMLLLHAERTVLASEELIQQQRSLLESEQRFRAVFEQSSVGMARVGPDGRWLQVNATLCRTVGYTADELKQLSFQDITHQDDLDKDANLLAALERAEIPEYSIEKRYIRKEGQIIWINLSVAAVRDETGAVLYYISIIKDISESQKQRAQLERAQTLANLGSWEVNLATGELNWSDQVFEIFGVDRDHFAGTEDVFFELTHPEDRDSLRRARELWLARGGELDEVHRIVRPDGEVRWVRERAQIIYLADRSVAHTSGTVQDVTTQVRVAREIEQQRRLFEATLECSAVGIIACDQDGQLITFNETARSWHNAGPEPLTSDQWSTHYRLYHGDGLTPLGEREIPLIRALNGESVEDVEMMIGDDVGTGRFVLASAAPVVDSDGVKMGAVVSMLDVTRRRQAEQALRRSYAEIEQQVDQRTRSLAVANKRLKELDELKSLFIASMSHELRTPLNSIIGFTGLLLRQSHDSLDERQRDYLKRVRGSGQHLLNLITDIIDVSKIEAGKLQPFVELVSIDEVINESLAIFELQAHEKGLLLSFEGEYGLKVKTDRKRLLQCVLNYISNAVKYSDRGEVRVRVTLESGWVTISVQDTGIGIAQEDFYRLFNQFSRVQGITQRSVPGTGLGLYLTSKLVRGVLRGDVGFDSKIGEGSRFWLSIPAGQRD